MTGNDQVQVTIQNLATRDFAEVNREEGTDDQAAYLLYLRSQGINLERLYESIEEYKAGKTEILDWDVWT